MDHIYQYLAQERRFHEKNEMIYSGVQESMYLYLTRVVASEFWWRLRILDKDDLIEEHIYGVKDANATLQGLKRVAGTAISNQSHLTLYGELFKMLDQFRRERNDSTHHYKYRLTDTITVSIKECDKLLKNISNSILKNPIFPVGITPDWKPLIPIGEDNGMLNCLVYDQEEDDLLGTTTYCWRERLISKDTPEFRRNGLTSNSCLQKRRLYFYKEPDHHEIGGLPEVSCAYPFVQIEVAKNRQSLSSIWLYDSIALRANGSCKGTDILGTDKSGKRDIAYVPELVLGHSSNNPYLMDVEHDNYRNPYPLRNLYKTNYPQWMENASSAKVIRQIVKHLKDGVPLIYVYGQGGIGKTAAIQRMLETEYYKPFPAYRLPIYSYLIFLSAKKKEWNDDKGIVPVNYGNGYQTFSDLISLRTCLRNIFAPGVSGLCQNPADEKDWYQGKTILLVLDDFESIEDEAEREKIRKYLNDVFRANTAKYNKRQTIITCRVAPSQGHSANVELMPLTEHESAAFANFCAKRMRGGREDHYRRELGDADQPDALTGQQHTKRKRLHKLTQGLPLVIRALVCSDKEARIEENSRTNQDLLDYLFSRTYTYLGTEEKQKLAFLASILTTNAEQNCIERLQFVWNFGEFSQNHNISDMLEDLYTYGVLVSDSAKTTFSFPDQYMRKYIEMGYANDKLINISDNCRNLADWLSREQQLSIPECLLLQLKKTVYIWYDVQQNISHYLDNLHGVAFTGLDQNHKPGDLLKDMILLYRAIAKVQEADPYILRSAVQLIVQVYCDDPSKAEILLDDILYPLTESELGTCYAMEVVRYSLLISRQRDKAPVINKLIAETLMNRSWQKRSDYRDRLLVLWNTMLLIEDMAAHGFKPADILTPAWDAATLDYTLLFRAVVKEDYEIFVNKLDKTLRLLTVTDQKQRKTMDNLKNRCMEMKRDARNASTEKPKSLFFGGRA